MLREPFRFYLDVVPVKLEVCGSNRRTHESLEAAMSGAAPYLWTCSTGWRYDQLKDLRMRPI